jgi:hypothetical protein
MQLSHNSQQYLHDRLRALQAEQQRMTDRREAMLDKLRRLERMHRHLSVNPAHAERCNDLMNCMLLVHDDLHALDLQLIHLRQAARAIIDEVNYSLA